MADHRSAAMRPQRRPVRLRDNRWVRATAARLGRVGIRPNQVSGASLVFAGLTAACLVLARSAAEDARSALFLAAAAFIPLRGLCNLWDGLLAVEGGAQTPAGEVFNDLPDRISDALMLVAAGYSVAGVPWAAELGWLAGLLAVMTAYVRLLGVAAGAPPQYCGPMAKTHRMALLGAACVAAAVEAALGGAERAMPLALAAVALGCVVTVARRTVRILRALASP